MHSFLWAICIDMNLMLWEHLWVRLSGGQFPHIISGTQASKLLFSKRNSCFVGQAFKIIFKHWLAERRADVHDILREEKEKS